jgi:FxsC-like protein
MAKIFFSYARVNYDAYLKTFADDLKRLLRSRIGGSAEDLFFLDRDSLESGSEWPQEIREALRTCRIFLSIESPDYFLSEYCGKEWKAFRQRLGKPAPPLHIRIEWIPVPKWQLEALPKAVQDIQHTRAVLDRDFEHLVRADPGPPFQLALSKLVDLIMHAWGKAPLPPADEIPELSQIESAFRSPAQTGVPQTATAKGIKHVRFGIIAGAQEEIRDFREHADGYGSDPLDWKPFHPGDPRPIAPFAQGVVAKLNLTSHFLGLEGDLQKELAEAEMARNLVIFLVDPWALEMQQHEGLLRSYNDMHFLSSLLIPWPSDPQTQSFRARLVELMRLILAKTALREPESYREEIDSLERLETELVKAITTATAHIVVDQAKITRSVESPRKMAMPLLTGPAGATDAL